MCLQNTSIPARTGCHIHRATQPEPSSTLFTLKRAPNLPCNRSKVCLRGGVDVHAGVQRPHTQHPTTVMGFWFALSFAWALFMWFFSAESMADGSSWYVACGHAHCECHLVCLQYDAIAPSSQLGWVQLISHFWVDRICMDLVL